MFIWGVVLFTGASRLCAIANSVEQLVGFRVLQGVGAALLVPASLALVVEGFDVARRAHGVGLWGAAAAIASGLGPPIGGAIVQVSNWRWAFLVNVPLGILAVFVARRLLVESHAPGQRRVPDLRRALLLAVALGLLTLGLIKGPDWSWASAGTIASFVGAALTLVGFVLSSRLHGSPLIEPAYLRVPSFVAGNALTIVAGAGFYGYPPYVYGGSLHVDGGVLDNLPVSALAGGEGPLVAVAIGFGSDAKPGTRQGRPPRIPGIAETPMRTMMMGSRMAAGSTMLRPTS